MIDISVATINELSKSSEIANFDPDKRVDTNLADFDKKTEKFDPDRRVDVSEKTHEQIKCINESLEGKVHPMTGVPFEKKSIELKDKIVDAIVPKFDSKFNAKLPDNLLEEKDRFQFKECNNQLKDALDKNDDLKHQFSPEQIEQIQDGETPDGYVWHHDAEVGKMQLVDFETHDKTAHTGGKAIWGGGSQMR